MQHRKIYAQKEETSARAANSRLRLFGRRLLEKLSGESSELSHLRNLMRKMGQNPSKFTIEEIRDIGGIFRSLSQKERTPVLELEVFACLSRARICPTDPVLRGVAETEFRIIDWKLRSNILQTFLNTS
jgi:hypothetical protein